MIYIKYHSRFRVDLPDMVEHSAFSGSEQNFICRG